MKNKCPKCGSNETTSHFGLTVYRCKDCGRLFEVASLTDKILYYTVFALLVAAFLVYLIKNS